MNKFVKKLEKRLNQSKKEDALFCEYPDVESFLAEKYKSQKEAEKFNLVFKSL